MGLGEIIRELHIVLTCYLCGYSKRYGNNERDEAGMRLE
jgi:RNase P subunit RPR2